MLPPFKEAIGGMDSKDVVSWSEDLVSFKRAQKALQDTKTIHTSNLKDIFCIVTDGALRNLCIGAILYISTNYHFLDISAQNCESAKYPGSLVK